MEAKVVSQDSPKLLDRMRAEKALVEAKEAATTVVEMAEVVVDTNNDQQLLRQQRQQVMISEQIFPGDQ